MNNKNLKKAFYEAAKKELEHLPEEEDIFRNYSDGFEAKMKKLLNEQKQKEMKVMNKKHFSFKKSAVVVAAIILCLTITASAGKIIQMKKAPELIPMLQEAVSNATVGMGVEEFDKAYDESDDFWKKANGDTQILPDYSESMDFDITVEDKGYVFTLKNVTKVLAKDLKMVSGNIMDGSAVFEWQVNDAYYAFVEVTRADGKKLDHEKGEWFEWGFMIEGFEPQSTNMCLRGYPIKEYWDDYTQHIAIDITNMMHFAGRDFAIVALEGGYGYNIDRETVYADKEGEMLLKNDDFIGALLRFRVDDKYADEKAAEEFIGETVFNNQAWFHGYTKD